MLKKLASSFLLTLAVSAWSAGFIFVTPSAAKAESGEQPLRYGSQKAVLSNNLSQEEFLAKFKELRAQDAVSGPTASSVNADAATPPAVTETIASATTTWTGVTVQDASAADELYMAWTDDRDGGALSSVYFSRSMDNGTTWTSATRIDKSSGGGDAGVGLNMVSDNHGNIVIIWNDERNEPDGQLFYNVSHDRGSSWSGEGIIDTQSRLGFIPMDGIAVDPSGNFYATWTDTRSGVSDIYAASSRDRGDTWTNEVRVDDTPADGDFTPLIVVTRDLDVVISWESDRNGGAGTDIYAAHSTDGAVTFAADQRLNTNNPAGAFAAYNGSLCSDGVGNVYSFYGLTTGGTGSAYVQVSQDFGSTWFAGHKKITGANFNAPFFSNSMIAGGCNALGGAGSAVISFNGSAVNITDTDDVFTAVSTDAGNTWSAAVRVNTGLAPNTGFFVGTLTTNLDREGHVVTAWTDNRAGDYDAYHNFSSDFGATWNTTDTRINGGTPGSHTVTLTDQTNWFFGAFSNGAPGDSTTDRLAFKLTYYDNRAGAAGIYHALVGFGGTPSVLNRLFGPSRVETSIATNVDLFPVAGTCPALVIATSGGFPDGLAAGPLAAMLNGGLILNPQNTLDADVAAEILRCLDLKDGADANVYVVGGPAAISDSVVTNIEALSTNIRLNRIFGANRYATSAEIAKTMDVIRGFGPSEAIIATGENFPDSLSASAPASDPAVNNDQMPILLVRRTSVDPEISAYIAPNAGTLLEAHVVGGTAAVNDAVLTTIDGMILAVDRIFGANRFETATAIADYFYSGDFDPLSVGIASGEGFADALGGGRASGAKHRPLVLVNNDAVPATTSAWISSRTSTVDGGDVYGGTAAIADSVVNSINGLL